MNPDTLVLVPAYNESDNILETVNNLRNFFEHILVINDGSTDNTQYILKENSIPCISHLINLGQGAALESGFLYFVNRTNLQYVITFDGDGQNNASQANDMLMELKKYSYSILIGSRFKKKKDYMEIPFFKRLTLRLAKIYERTFFSIKLDDAHNGLRVMTKEMIKNHILPIKNHDMSHSTEIAFKASNSGEIIYEYPVTVEYKNKRSQHPINAVNIVINNLIKRL